MSLFQVVQKVILKGTFFLVYLGARLLPAKIKLKLWNHCSEDLKSGKDFVEVLLPTSKNKRVILAALLRASIRSSVSRIPPLQGKLAVSDRISIGESLTYFHYSLLRGKRLGHQTYALDLGIAPNSEVSRFIFPHQNRFDVRDPLHVRVREQIQKCGTDLEEVAINLYVNGLASKFLKKRRWPDIGKPYHRQSDPNLKVLKKEAPELEASYLDFLQGENFYSEICEYCKIVEEQTERIDYPGEKEFDLKEFKNKLGIEKKYITLFLRPSTSDITAPRSVHNREAYLSAIRFLNEKGYQVILLGTSEGSRFPETAPLKGTIDYPHSGFQTLIHDLYLVRGCEFMITCNSGPSLMAPLFQKPTLWLNTVNPAQAIMMSNHRFYPKNVLKKDGRNLFFEEWLKSPALYAQHDRHYREAYLQWRDLDGEQIFDAVRDFTEEFERNNGDWRKKTERQKFFTSKLRPYHLNLYTMQGLPCESFLKHIQCPELLS